MGEWHFRRANWILIRHMTNIEQSIFWYSLILNNFLKISWCCITQQIELFRPYVTLLGSRILARRVRSHLSETKLLCRGPFYEWCTFAGQYSTWIHLVNGYFRHESYIITNIVWRCRLDQLMIAYLSWTVSHHNTFLRAQFLPVVCHALTLTNNQLCLTFFLLEKRYILFDSMQSVTVLDSLGMYRCGVRS